MKQLFETKSCQTSYNGHHKMPFVAENLKFQNRERIKAFTAVTTRSVDSIFPEDWKVESTLLAGNTVVTLPCKCYRSVEYTTFAVYIVNNSGLNDPLIFYKIFSTYWGIFFELQLIQVYYWANNSIFSYVEDEPFFSKVVANVLVLDLLNKL